MEPSEQVKVERLSPRDASLAARAVNTIKPVPERGGVDVTEEWMHEFLENDRNILLVAHDDGNPLGFSLGYRLDRVDRARPMMLFYEIGVLESHRGAGIARAMVGRLKDICKAQNAMKMWVVTDEDNRAARGLYEAARGRLAAPHGLVYVWEGDELG
jgi:ribosomal protein S18 acetylase RimI-like enzyme